jgi:hypothetical protein
MTVFCNAGAQTVGQTTEMMGTTGTTGMGTTMKGANPPHWDGSYN